MAFKFLALSVLVATLAIGTHGQGLLGNIPSLLNEVLGPVSGLLTPVTGILEPVLGPDGVLSGILDNNVLGLVQIVSALQKIAALVVGLLQIVLSLLNIDNIPLVVQTVFQQIQILLKEIVQLVVVELIPKLLLGGLSGGAASSVAP